MVWNLSPLKVILVLGKAISHVVPNLGSREHWVTWVIWCYAKNSPWDEIDEAANDWLPLVAAFWIIWIVSMEECSNLMQNFMQICLFPHSVILNVMVTQYTCSFNGVYSPHWLVQWSHHYLHMFIPVHSLWLPDYIDVAQTILFILTMAGLFPDRA